jgi:hypothetical protein
VTGRLAILDAKTGGRIALMGSNLLDVFYSNTQTDRIIVGTSTGVLQCLRESELEWPLVHVNLAEAEQQRRPEIKQEGLEAKPEPKPAAVPADDEPDPFGGGAAPQPAAGPGDPFGGPAPPPAAAGAADDDPFR